MIEDRNSSPDTKPDWLLWLLFATALALLFRLLASLRNSALRRARPVFGPVAESPAAMMDAAHDPAAHDPAAHSVEAATAHILPPVVIPNPARWLVFATVAALLIVLLVFLPAYDAARLFVVLVAGSLAAAGVSERRRLSGWWRDLLRAMLRLYRSASLPLNLSFDTAIPLWRMAAEVGLIVVVALALTHDYRQPDLSRKLAGGEAEWLTSSAYLAADSLREYGYIPLWQPYLEFGEPLIDQPFSFVLNPISTLPSLLYGGVQGIRYSVVLYAMFAGAGGWFLGRMLGLGALGRVLLGLLLLGKGNMQAMIGTGYYQLGVTQAYFPWIIGGMVGVLRARGRWPVVLTALMFTLMFWAGNIWYTLPMLLSMALLAAWHMFGLGRRAVNWPALRRLLLMALLTLGLSAITFIPLFGQRENAVGGHNDERLLDETVDLEFVAGQFFDGSMQPYYDGTAPGGIQFYYSFVTPLWFAVLIFLVIPPIWPFLHRPAAAEGHRIWLPALVLILFTTSWGAGGNSFFLWLYAHVPLLGQWRFVGRALAVASFWIAVLVAMRTDSLWRAIQSIQWPRIDPFITRGIRQTLALLLTMAALYAAYQVNSHWDETAPLDAINVYDSVCIDWLRDQFPDRELAVYMHGYTAVTTYIENRVRLFNIEADYNPVPMPSTLGHVSLLGFNSMPEFALVWTDSIRSYVWGEGYRPLNDSPRFGASDPCVWRKPDALSYAYSIPLDTFMDTAGKIPARLTTPITQLDRKPDRIRLWVAPDERQMQVVTIQELAYPGWTVTVDDCPATLEVIGGQVGVLLPPAAIPGPFPYEIVFQYRPPLLYQGAAITLVTWGFCILYLGRAGRLVGALWRRRARR